MILDSYIPKNGSYLMIPILENGFGDPSVLEINYNIKTKELEGSMSSAFPSLCYYDYYSRITDINKPVDKKKQIHSNNYLSFYAKKESILAGNITDEIIDGYYEVLANPYIKYTKPKAKQLYKELDEEYGDVDIVLLESIKGWIKENINQLSVDLSDKNYLKIFFCFEDVEKTKALYKQEGSRYQIPNMYNNNDYNTTIDGDIYGVPNNNMGLNSKKPFMEHRTRKNKSPYLLNKEEAMMQTLFFDYLEVLVNRGFNHIYFDTTAETIRTYDNEKLPDIEFSGHFLRIQKGKEVEIHEWDIVTNYKPGLQTSFQFEDIIGVSAKHSEYLKRPYGPCTKLSELRELLDDVLFSKQLIFNSTRDISMIKINDSVLRYYIISYREKLFKWFYLGYDVGIKQMIDKASQDLIVNSIISGNSPRASHQFNLRYSFNKYFSGGAENMADITNKIRESLREKVNADGNIKIDTDEEYFYAVGQLSSFFLSKSKSYKKVSAFINPIIRGGEDKVLKNMLSALFIKYNYGIEYKYRKFNNLYSMISGYVPDGSMNKDIVIAGFLGSSLIYEKKAEDESNE